MPGVKEGVLDLVHRNSVLAIMSGIGEVPATERDAVAIAVRGVVTRWEHLARDACLVDIGRCHPTVDPDLLEGPAMLIKLAGGGHARRAMLGTPDGLKDGHPDGLKVGEEVGLSVGRDVGLNVGALVGLYVGAEVGFSDGRTVGGADSRDGFQVGGCVGADEGANVGAEVG